MQRLTGCNQRKTDSNLNYSMFLQPVRWSNGVFKYKVNTFFGQPDYIQSQ